uniref:Uncharacterized protein n=1 Tax=Panagrolaimus sp. JU765 TaxID=591449 RepID=A0AC34RA89_9BILA
MTFHRYDLSYDNFVETTTMYTFMLLLTATFFALCLRIYVGIIKINKYRREYKIAIGDVILDERYFANAPENHREAVTTMTSN